MKNKAMINLGIILLTIATVLAVRIEARKTSYKVYKKYSQLKEQRQNLQHLSAMHHAKNGYNFMSDGNSEHTMIAIRANKAKQVVMVQKNLMVTAK